MPSFKRHRKPETGKSGGSSTSKSLRDARNLIQSGKQADGLAILNRLSSENKNPGRRAKIALLIGTSESGLSRHSEAAAAFAKAGQLARQAGDPSLSLKAGIGEIRSLLRSLKNDEAKAAADLILQDLGKAQQSFDDLADLRPEQLAAKGAVILPPRPPRATVALTSIATAFTQSGLNAEAQGFLEKAIILSPNGASRARQALAKLALAADQPELAERYARESLQMGRFQAKTVAAWPLYLDARARQNLTPILEPSLFEGLLAHSKGRIFAASVLAIIRLLRTHGDDSWKAIAHGTLRRSNETDPIIITEIEKIIHADAKLALSLPPQEIASRALELFRADSVSKREQISHAKDYIRFSFVAGSTPDLAFIVEHAFRTFGQSHATALRHASALGAMMAREHDIARIWLRAIIDKNVPGSESWGRAMWATARMQALLGRMNSAAEVYLGIAEEKRTPPRFRIQSMMFGIKCLEKSEGEIDLLTIGKSIRSILASVDDFRILFDAARQLSLAGGQLIELKKEAGERGAELADRSIGSSSSREALAIIEYVARKQYWDLDESPRVINRWRLISEKDRKEYQTIGGTKWYEYLALVIKALVSEKQEAEAVKLAASVIDTGTSTPEGLVIVGSEYADILFSQGQREKALGFYEWISKESPRHRKAAFSHYVIALNAYKRRNFAQAKTSAEAARLCYAGTPSLLNEWEVDCRSALLMKRLGVVSDFARFSDDFIGLQGEELDKDIIKF